MSIFMGVVILNMVVSSCLRICFSWFVSGYAGGSIAESVFSADLLVSFSICRILSDAFGAESIFRLSRSRDSSFLVVWRFSSLLGFGLAIVCSSTFLHCLFLDSSLPDAHHHRSRIRVGSCIVYRMRIAKSSCIYGISRDLLVLFPHPVMCPVG